jgi:restriction system protein
MARRGFLAELQHQSRVAAREAERRRNAASREHQAAVRRAEQARKADERARAQAGRAAEAERKRLEREAAAAHVAAMQAEVEELNAGLAEQNAEIDGLLAATLEVDDYVDLDALRRAVEHPPFDRTDLEAPVPSPQVLPPPPEPVFTPPTGVLGKKKKQAEAEAAYAQTHAVWRTEVDSLPARQQAAAHDHARAEAQRHAALERERERYQAECAARDSEVAEHNAAIDTLIANLGYGAVDAVQEYVQIVLANSVYPEHFAVEHEFEFDPSTAELRIRVLVPPPSSLEDVKAYKYTKASDEITTTALSQKACKDRYTEAIEQVALRTLHEIFESDRRGLIKSIAAEVGTETTDPATGKQSYVPFVAVAAERTTFLDFDLSAVVTSATLQHLGAAVSKNPFGLVAADTTGVRKS